MKHIKAFLSTPYPYIFLLSYAGVWAVWDTIKLPFSNPAEVISYIPSVEYNPTNNLLRFAIAVLLPPLICLAYWWISRHQRSLQQRLSRPGIRYILGGAIVGVSLLVSMSMGIVQNSTNPANNPPTVHGGPYTHAMVDTFHEGETLGPAISYSDPSKVPYRDFVIVHGVFQDPVRTVLAFKLFGKSIGASRAMTTILTMAAFVLLYALLMVLFRGNLIRSTLGLVAFAMLVVPPAVIPFLRDYILGIQLPFRDIATILFLICAVLGFRYYVAQKYWHTGVLAGVVGFIALAGFANSLDRAFYIFALALVWLSMLFVMAPGRKFIKDVLLWFAGGAAMGIAVLSLALKGHFADFWQYIVDITKYKEFLDGIAFGQPGPEVTILLLAFSASIGAALFWIIREFSRPAIAKQRTLVGKLKASWPVLQKVVREHHTVILLGITAVFFMRSALGRALIDHFIYAIEWFYLFVIYVLLVYVYPLRKKISFTVGFMTIAGLLVTAAIYGSLVKKIDIAADAFPVNISDEQVVREDYLQAADYLKKNLAGDETFVTLTSEGIWYYLVDKPSPVQYPIIWYAFTKKERTELAKSFEQNNTIKYVVTNDHWTTNFDYIPNQQRFPELYEALHKQYEPKIGFGSQTIWARK